MSHSVAAQSAIEFTKAVTEKWPERLTGRQACLDCGNYLKTEFDQFSDQAFLESFDIHPNAFLGYLKIEVVLYVFAFIALLLESHIIAMCISIVATIIMVGEFMFYKELVDPLFKKRQGQNVYGIIEPAKEVRQQIIVSAHHDSAHIFNFLEKNAKWYPLRILSAIVFQNLLLVISVILGIATSLDVDMPQLTFWSKVIFGIGLLGVLPLWFFVQDKGTPGAGDNMICTAAAMEVGKYFHNEKTNNRPLQHTRVIIASWDAEECGLRGARAYVAKHRERLLKTKTYNFNLECLYDHQSMKFLTSDLNDFVPLSKSMVEECQLVADTCGYKVGAVSFPMLAGGTDAAEMAKAGIEATCLIGMSFDSYGSEPAYHTSRDTIDAVDPKAVEAAIEIGKGYILRKDNLL